MLYFDNRWQLICNRALFRSTQDIYRLGPLQVLVDYNAGDANSVRECLSSPMYRDLVRQLNFERPINLLDIGAHAGGFTLLCQHLGIGLKKVVSVELNPKTISRLVFNLSRNLQCLCSFENVAIASREGTLELQLGNGSTGDSIYAAQFDTTSTNVESVRVRSVTFDSLYNKHFGDDLVDLCKMDIEGAEHEVLGNPGHERLRSGNLRER